jgi:beta-lactamase class D
MAEIIGTFPDGILSSEALTRLAERLAEREIPFDRKADNDLKTVSRARRLAGFAVKGRRWFKHPDSKVHAR